MDEEVVIFSIQHYMRDWVERIGRMVQGLISLLVRRREAKQNEPCKNSTFSLFLIKWYFAVSEYYHCMGGRVETQRN